MFAAGYGTVSDIEIIWSLIALIGLVFSIVTSYSSYGDYKFLKNNEIENGRRLIAKVSMFTEFGRAYLQTVFLFVGIVSMRFPDPQQRQLSTLDYALQTALRWSFIAAAVVTAAKSIYAWHIRRRLLGGG